MDGKTRPADSVPVMATSSKPNNVTECAMGDLKDRSVGQ